jgi:hypothetical protein
LHYYTAGNEMPCARCWEDLGIEEGRIEDKKARKNCKK